MLKFVEKQGLHRLRLTIACTRKQKKIEISSPVFLTDPHYSPIQLFDVSLCIDCNGILFPIPNVDDHCKPRGTCPLSEFDLKHSKKHFQMHFLANFTTTVDPQDALFLLSFSCIFDKAWHQHPDIPQNIAKQRKRKFFQTESQWWTNKVQVVKGCKIRPLFFWCQLRVYW